MSGLTEEQIEQIGMIVHAVQQKYLPQIIEDVQARLVVAFGIKDRNPAPYIAKSEAERRARAALARLGRL